MHSHGIQDGCQPEQELLIRSVLNLLLDLKVAKWGEMTGVACSDNPQRIITLSRMECLSVFKLSGFTVRNLNV